MISTKLLSEVTQSKVRQVMKVIDSKLWYKAGQNNNVPHTWTDVYINIYELAWKCKQWALDNHYSILLELSFPLSGIIIINREGEEVYDEVSNKPEHELIFKGCEWILKQKEKI